MSITKEQIVEAVATMSVTDIVELIKIMEKKFGVSNANVNTNTNTDVGVAETVEEKTEFDVILKAIGTNKIAVIKTVRRLIGLGLKEAKDLVESSPITLKESVYRDEAMTLKTSLEESGAEVEIK